MFNLSSLFAGKVYTHTTAHYDRLLDLLYLKLAVREL